MTNPGDPVLPSFQGEAGHMLPTIGGLTKREWFAGMAIQGLLAGFKIGMINPSTEILKKEVVALPSASLALADALITELNKKP